MIFFEKRDTKKMSESEKYKRSKVYKKYLRQRRCRVRFMRGLAAKAG